MHVDPCILLTTLCLLVSYFFGINNFFEKKNPLIIIFRLLTNNISCSKGQSF